MLPIDQPNLSTTNDIPLPTNQNQGDIQINTRVSSPTDSYGDKNNKTKQQIHPVTTMIIPPPLKTPNHDKLESKQDYKLDCMIYQTVFQLEIYMIRINEYQYSSN